MRPTPFRRRAALAAAAITVAATAACSGHTTAKTTAQQVTPSPTNALPAAHGDIANLNWDLPQGEPTTLDPVQSLDFSSSPVVAQMCDTLLRENPDMTTSPGLVTATQAGPTTVQLKLRAGVKFWDGHPVTVDDVVYSLNRDLDPNAPAYFVFQHVKSVTATGSDQVTITLTQPDELFMKELGGVPTAVIEKAYAEKAGKQLGTASGGLMCSGPYEWSSWTPGSQIVLKHNDAYWDPAYRGHAATITFKFVTDTAALAQGLASGELDGAYEIPASILPTLQKTSTGTVWYGPSTESMGVWITHPHGVIGNVDLRKALMISLDRGAIAKSIYHGAATANYTALATEEFDPTATALYQQDYQSYVKANAYDLSAAKQLVKSSGYAGQNLVLATLAGDETQAQLAQYMQQQAAQIGVKVTIDAVQPLQYSKMSYDDTARQGTDMLLALNYNGARDPLEFLGFEAASQSPYNYTQFSDSTVDADMAQAFQTFDPTTRAKLILNLQRRWEASYSGTSLVGLYETSFLSNKLTGATTSFAYMQTPALALVGPK
jgi:peptide/nickel transport system substrate-binding protein